MRSLLAGLTALFLSLAPGPAHAVPVGHVRLALDRPATFPDVAHTASRNDVVVLQAWQTDRLHALKAANPFVKVLMYQNVGGATTSFGPPTAPTIPDAGLTKDQAAAGGWLLHSIKTGQPFAFDAYAGLWGADVGSKGYADAWAANVLGRLRADPQWNGVFMDDVDTSMEFNHTPSDILEYPTDAAYQGAVGRFLAEIYPQFQNAHELAVANIGNWVDNFAVGKSWVPDLDAAMDEKFVKWGRQPADGPAGPAGYRPTAQWLSQVQEIVATEAAGRSFYAVSFSKPDDEAAARFGYASALLASTGHTDFDLAGGAVGDGTDDFTSETWFPEYDLVLGAPVDPVPHLTPDASGIYRRAFAGGLVLVNPAPALEADGKTPTPPVTVSFSGQYSGPGVPNGATSASLAPHSALVLTAGTVPVTTPDQFPLYVAPAPIPPPPPPVVKKPAAKKKGAVKGVTRHSVPLVRRTRTTLTLQAEALKLPRGAKRFGDAKAHGAVAVVFRARGRATRTIAMSRLAKIQVRARAAQCGGGARLLIRVNGRIVMNRVVRTSRWTVLATRLHHRVTVRTLGVSFTNAHATRRCRRDLRVDTVVLHKG